MSIAVCVVARPSLRLRLSYAVFAVGAFAAALLLSGRLDVAGPAAPWAGGSGGAVASGLAGLFFCVRFALALDPRRYAVRLDITAVGHLRAAVYQGMEAAGVAAGSDQADGGAVDQCGLFATLLPGSTLWAGLLLLRVHMADGSGLIVPVWPDSVDNGLFRPLAAACRVIATCHMDH